MTAAPIDQPDFQNPQTGMAVYATIPVANPVAAGVTVGPFDLGAYNSIIVWSDTSVVAGHALIVRDDDSGFTITVLRAPVDGAGVQLPPTIIPVRGQKITIKNGTGVSLNINIRATSRIVADIQNFQAGDTDSFTAALPAAAGAIDLGDLTGSGAGFVYLELSLSTISGWFQLVSNNRTIRIAQHGELIAGPGGIRTTTKSITLPGGAYRAQFNAASAIAASARMDIIYRG